jgi:hypothetical protein
MSFEAVHMPRCLEFFMRGFLLDLRIAPDGENHHGVKPYLARSVTET